VQFLYLCLCKQNTVADNVRCFFVMTRSATEPYGPKLQAEEGSAYSAGYVGGSVCNISYTKPAF
jgi:hypothetical protein